MTEQSPHSDTAQPMATPEFSRKQAASDPAKLVDFPSAANALRPKSSLVPVQCLRCRRDFLLPAGTKHCLDCGEIIHRCERRLFKSGISVRHARLKTWAELRPPESGVTEWHQAVRVVRDFVASGSSILALIGTRGTGKTQLGAIAVRQTIEIDRSAKLVQIIELLANLKARFETDGDAGWLEEWSRPHLLVIDEIAERIDSDWSRCMFTTLLDRRYGACRPTILIGNVTAADFDRVVGASVASRCSEGGGVVVCEWSSYRC